MRYVKDYRIAAAESIGSLEREVDELAKRGYVTAGGLLADFRCGDFYQAMVKYSENKEDKNDIREGEINLDD